MDERVERAIGEDNEGAEVEEEAELEAVAEVEA